MGCGRGPEGCRETPNFDREPPDGGANRLICSGYRYHPVVGWFTRLRRRARGLSMGPGPGGAPNSTRFGLGAPVDLLTAIAGLDGAVAPRVSRAEALQVPAVARARNMIA